MRLVVRPRPAAPSRRAAEGRTKRADESALVERVHSAASSVEPVRGSRLVDVTFTSTRSEVRGARDQHARRRVRRPEPRRQAADAPRTCSTGSTRSWTSQQKKVEESERALAEYRDKQNAMSLDDKQNIVVARLNQLNDAVIKAQDDARPEGSALQPGQVDLGGHRRPTRFPVIATEPAGAGAARASWPSCSARRCGCSERYGDKHPAGREGQRGSSRTRSASSTSRPAKALQSVKNEYETAVLEERTLSQNLEAAKADAQDLNRKSIGYSVMEREAQEQPPGLRVAAAAREGAARREQQPREQRPRRRSRRGAEGADDAERPPHVADVDRRSAWCWPSAWRSASTT